MRNIVGVCASSFDMHIELDDLLIVQISYCANALAHTSAVMALVAGFFLRPLTLTFINFYSPLTYRPYITCWKDLNPKKRCTKNQEASSILKVIFALSK